MSYANSECVLLVPSCDAYCDLWPTFLYGLGRQWPNCPYKILFGTSGRTDVAATVTTLSSGAGLIWSERMIDYLRRIEHKYVLLMLEDFILRRPVDNQKIAAAEKFMIANELDCLRLVAREAPESRSRSIGNFGRIEPGESYRISTQAAFWNKEFLLNILRRGESIWEFELNGGARVAEKRCEIWGVYKSILPYEGFGAHHVVEKGKWIPHERWILALRGYPIVRSARPAMDAGALLCYHLGQTFARVSHALIGRRAPALRRRLISVLPGGLLTWYYKKRGFEKGR